MPHTARFRCSASLPILALALLLAGSAPAVAQLGAVVHFVTPENLGCTGSRCTFVDGAPWFLDHPEVRQFATSSFNPPGSPGVAYAAPIAHTSFTSDHTRNALIGPPGAIPLGAAFNVLAVRGPRPCVFGHFATAANIQGDATILDRPALNGDPSALLLVMDVDASLGPTNLGVAYDADLSRWTIFNQDGAAMAEFRAFAVFDDSCAQELVSFHLVTCAAPSGDSCALGALGLGDHDAKLLVTQRLAGEPPVFNPHSIGVRYDTGSGAWQVFNQDGADLPLGAAFHVAELLVLLADDFESNDFAGWTAASP